MWSEERLIVELDGGAVHGTDRAFETDRAARPDPARRGLALAAGHLAAAARRTGGDRGRPAAGCCARLDGLLPCSDGPRAIRALPRRRGAGAERRPDGAFTGAAGGAACGDLSRLSLHWSRAAASPRSASTPRAAAPPTPPPPPSPRPIDGAPVLEAARLAIDDVEARDRRPHPGQAPRRRLAADALHRALGAAAASGVPLATPPPQQASPTPARRRRHVRRRRQRRRGAAGARARGARWSASPSSSGPIRRPTGPRPAARRRRCSAPAPLAHSLGIPHFTLDLEEEFRAPRRRPLRLRLRRRAAPRTPASSATARCGSRRWSTSPSGSAPTRLLTGHYARIVEDADGPLLAAGGRRGQGPELHAGGAAAAAARDASASR